MACLIFYLVIGICYTVDEFISGVLRLGNVRYICRVSNIRKLPRLTAFCAQLTFAIVFTVAWPYFLIKAIKNITRKR